MDGTAQEAQDAAQCASVNWMWKNGCFEGGLAVRGEYGIAPAKRLKGQAVPPDFPNMTLVDGEKNVP